MEQTKQFTMEEIKEALTEMKIPYTETEDGGKYEELIRSFHYESLGLTVDLKAIDSVDANWGVVVRNADPDVDNGIYVFTILNTGRAGFFVILPGTVSREPMIRNVACDIISAINGMDLPPLMPFDMVEITAHVLVNTFMNTIMESCGVPKEHRKRFTRLYLPKFLSNVGMYFVGAIRDDGSPMIYEEIVNIEPMVVYRAITKGDADNEGAEGTADASEEENEDEA